MIALLQGTLIEKSAGTLVVSAGGVGYEVRVPLSALARLPEPEVPISLFIRTVVREDSITLYGFDERRERELFDLLVTVKGVGPRVALGVLSGMPYQTLIQALFEKDTKALTAVPGLGRKTAERVILEISDKAAVLARDMALEGAAEEMPQTAQDALSALLNLGYTRVEAARAVDRAMKESGEDAPLEDVIALALKKRGRT